MRPGVAAALILLVAAVGPLAACHRRDATPAAAPTPPRSDVAAAKAGAANGRGPFIHALLSQASNGVAHEDCSQGALERVTARMVFMQTRVAPAGASGAARKAKGTGGCPAADADAFSQQVKGELVDRVGACVGRDGPFDTEWDMINSGLLSLQGCLDCRRARNERLSDCARSHDVVERAEKSARQPRVAAPPR